MDSLTLNYEPDDADCVGRLFVRVRTASFSGYGFVWAQPNDIEEFASKLGAYPILAEDPPMLRWGLEDCQDDNLILDIKVAPADARGNLLVRVELANMYEPQERVRTRFLTDYSDLQVFRDSLPAIVRGEEARATLLGRR